MFGVIIGFFYREDGFSFGFSFVCFRYFFIGVLGKC